MNSDNCLIMPPGRDGLGPYLLQALEDEEGEEEAMVEREEVVTGVVSSYERRAALQVGKGPIPVNRELTNFQWVSHYFGYFPKHPQGFSQK